jgi:hypothetical protein
MRVSPEYSLYVEAAAKNRLFSLIGTGIMVLGIALLVNLCDTGKKEKP